jgi:hypothetical protein
MNIIEQRIRMYIQKQFISEADNKSGYDIKIPGTILAGELKRWRVEHVNQQAKKNGCIRGFLIVATKRELSANDSLLMSDIVNTIIQNSTFSGYYSNDYRIILSNPVERGKRKIYAAWIIDMRTTKPTPFRVLLNKLQAIQKTNVYQEYQKFEKYVIGTTEIIDQSRAIAWINSINKYLAYLEKTKPDWYKQNFNTDNDIIKRQFRSIPDFTSMNRNIVPAEADADVEDISAKSIEIDQEWKNQNNFGTSFDGTAIVGTDPITGIKTIIPVKGTIEIIEDRSGRPGIFDGTFKNGAPENGLLRWFPRNGSSYDDNQTTSFEGEFNAKTLITIDAEAGPKGQFHMDKIKGKLYYNKKDDPGASYFEGTFTNNMPSSGFVYEQDSELENYNLVGQLVNGKYTTFGKPVKYPYKTPGTGQMLYQLKDDLEYVYSWFPEKNAWGRVLTSMHTKFVNDIITADVFLKWINYITDPKLVTELSTKFNEGTNYVLIKPNTTIDVYDASTSKKIGTYDPTTDKRGIQLEWIGGDKQSGWYEVLMKNTVTNTFLTKTYWISAKDVDSEMKNYPFK